MPNQKQSIINLFFDLEVTVNPQIADRIVNDTVMLSVQEARRIVQKLENDASWDKCGSGYYSMKDQLDEIDGKKSWDIT